MLSKVKQSTIKIKTGIEHKTKKKANYSIAVEIEKLGAENLNKNVSLQLIWKRGKEMNCAQ